jgi:predicted metal-binding protein
MSESPRPRLIVCITCRAGQALADGEAPQGALLHAALSGLLANSADPPVDLRTASCMANCERGCTAAIAMPAKWTFVLAHLSPDHAADLLTYAGAYAASATGTVMPSRRPASLGGAVLARVPDLEFAA